MAPTSGLITGVPAAAGNYSFIVQVSDSQAQSVQKAFTLTIAGRINIATAAVLPSATVKQAYNQTLTATGGTPPYSWSLAAGGTPPLGLTLDRNGVLSGTPVSAGAFNFTAQVTDSQNISATRTFTLSVLLNLSITTAQALPGHGRNRLRPTADGGGRPASLHMERYGRIAPGRRLPHSRRHPEWDAVGRRGLQLHRAGGG